ncbi:MAG: ATP-binding protein [Planctomycetota bacterium]
MSASSTNDARFQKVFDGRETWSLRRQLIVPIGATILLVALAVSGITWWAVRDSEQRWAAEKMDSVYEQLRVASFPLTERVLEQIRNYSGVDVVVIPHEGVSVTTLDPNDFRDLSSAERMVSEPSGKLTLGDRVVHYRTYDASRSFRDVEVKALVLFVPQPRDTRFLFGPVWAPIASGLISILAMILVTTAVGSRIVRRIEDLESQVVRIASGSFDVVEPSGPDDAIRRLSISINSMSSQLATAQDWIARTERSRLISMIAGGMAHQLRNSLTGASLLIQSFRRSQPGEPAKELTMDENQLISAADAVRRLLASDPNIELVDEPEMPALAIQEAVRDCVAMYAQHREVSLLWESGGCDGGLWIPQGSAVVGAIVNLVMNAIEATGRGGEVRCQMSTEPSSHSVCWRIADNGPGPDPSLANAIMEPFVTTKKEGIGLGLAMAARVANRCRGSLAWRRKEPNTIFELTIPCTEKANPG